MKYVCLMLLFVITIAGCDNNSELRTSFVLTDYSGDKRDLRDALTEVLENNGFTYRNEKWAKNNIYIYYTLNRRDKADRSLVVKLFFHVPNSNYDEHLRTVDSVEKSVEQALDLK